MHAVNRRGVVQATSQQKLLRIAITQVGRHLHEVIIGFVCVLVVQVVFPPNQ